MILVAAVFLARGVWRDAARISVGVVVIVVLAGAARRGVGKNDVADGLPVLLHFGSAEYYWQPSLGTWPPLSHSFFDNALNRSTLANWRRTLAEPAKDAVRECVWRVFHGIFGAEFYDARWSPAYRALDHSSRIGAPFVILAAVSLALAVGFRRPGRAVGAAAAVVFLFACVQNVLCGSNPRLILPFLPVIVLLGCEGLARATRRDFLRASALFAAGVAMIAWAPQVASWDFGVIDAAGTTIRQEIPQSALPERVPAVLHVRLAAPIAGGPDLAVAVDDRPLAATPPLTVQRRPVATFPLPQGVLDENRRRAVTLRLQAFGAYGPDAYLIFAVIPPPWRIPARKSSSEPLSRRADVASGSLDWWAHSGAR